MVSLQLTVLGALVIAHSVKPDVIVTLNDGSSLEGTRMTSDGGFYFYSFRGIPYAEPPEGALRFRSPVPKAPWPGKLFHATRVGPICPQLAADGLEDCLRLNVHTRKIPNRVGKKEERTNSAVLVFIHGGGFIASRGTSDRCGPQFIMDVDVVLVTFNYRLGALGFLSTADKASPGNYGMLDQVLALQWVQHNIQSFGGDRHRVTIFGNSAGAASVSFHLLSPLSAGLFHGAVSMSGEATCSWALKEDERYWAKRLGKDVGCPVHNSQMLVECLRTVPAQRIVNATPEYVSTGIFALPFAPNVDGYFLPDHPARLLQRPNQINRVPVVSGINQKEGIGLTSEIFTETPSTTLTSDEFLTSAIGTIFGTHEPILEITEMIKRFYFSYIDRHDPFQVQRAFFSATSDGLMDAAHYQFTNTLARAGFVMYLYSYEYKMFNFSIAGISGIEGDWGVTHGDEMPMYFKIAEEILGPIWYSEQDRLMRRNLIKMLTDFAKYGKPVPRSKEGFPEWPPSRGDNLAVYHINNAFTVTGYNPITDPKFGFWNVAVKAVRDRAYASFKGNECKAI